MEYQFFLTTPYSMNLYLLNGTEILATYGHVRTSSFVLHNAYSHTVFKLNNALC